MAHFGLWFLFALALSAGVSDAAVHDVGGSAAWTINVNYDKWASSRNFHVSDTLVFKYNNQFHNVKQVRHQDYQSCNATAAVAVYSSGSDSVTLKRPGHYYFLCGFPGHCQAGQKVDVLVKPSSVRGPSPSPSQAPPISPTPGSQSASGPALGPKSGSSTTSSPGFWFWLVVGVSVARVF